MNAIYFLYEGRWYNTKGHPRRYPDFYSNCDFLTEGIDEYVQTRHSNLRM